MRTNWEVASLAELALAESIDGDIPRGLEHLSEYDARSGHAVADIPWVSRSSAEVARALLAQESGDTEALKVAVDRLASARDRLEFMPLLLVAEATGVRCQHGSAVALARFSASTASARKRRPLREPWNSYATAFEVMLNISLGNLARAERLLATHSAPTAAPLRIERARLALFASNDVEALILARAAAPHSETQRQRADSELISAVAAWCCDRPDEAFATLDSAVETIEQRHLFGLLLGMPFAQIHALALAARAAGGRDLVTALEATSEHVRAHRYERLTEMELRALSAIRDHASAAQAATSLFVTTGTVKKHLVSVYRKLRVGDRDSAILRATSMGLFR